jgi:hypothetical protein
VLAAELPSAAAVAAASVAGDAPAYAAAGQPGSAFRVGTHCI